MKIAEHKPEQPYDEMLPRIVAIARNAIMDTRKNDDAVFLFVGNTGTGKTHLTLWVDTLFTPNPDPKQITLSTEDFADSVERGLMLPKGERFLHFDETNVNRREGMSKWNRAMIKLYFKIREEGFLHLWDHPSPNNIDHEFIRERINGLFLCYDKSVERPRRYYFFTKEQLLDFLDTHGRLSTRGLQKHASEYALYRGSYRAYNGPLLEEYKKQKKAGMREAIQEFASDWGSGNKTYTVARAAKTLGVGNTAVKNAVSSLLNDGTLKREEITNPAGHHVLNETHLDLIKNQIQKTFEEISIKRGNALRDYRNGKRKNQ